MTTSTLLLLLLLSFLLLHLHRPVSGDPLERAALLRLRRRVASDPSGLLASWSLAVPHCSWRFVACDPATGRVVSLDLSPAAAAGGSLRLSRLPRALSRLSALQTLALPALALSGPIPPSLTGLRRLRRLDLSSNRLSGPIPAGLGSCGDLRTLSLSSNALEGAIPPEIGRLRRLRTLDLSRNRLSGSVPAELGDCRELTALVLSDASAAEGNRFAGRLDERIARLPKLRLLWAPGASLEGTIPEDWGSCASLEVVNFGGNSLRGTLPPRSFAGCRQLRYLNLSSNELVGELDRSLPVPCLDVLDVSGNRLHGEIPEFSRDSCGATSDVSAAYSTFPGATMPLEGVLSRFRTGSQFAVVHDFSKNNLSGSTPSLPIRRDGLEGLSVYALLLSGNRLSGPFPQHLLREFRSSGSLVLDFSNNMVSGVIPAEIGSMCASLAYLDASGNRISGTIPQDLGLCSALEHLDLSRNMLHSRIPASLGMLGCLRHLSLAANELTGDIPSGLGRLPLLEVLDLSSNSLTGAVPSGFIPSGNLSILLLGNQKTSVPIPNGARNGLFESVLSGDTGVNRVITSFVYSARIRGRSLEETPPSGKGSGFTSIEIASISSAAAIVSVLFALIIVYIYTRKCTPRARVQAAGKKEVTVFVNIGAPLTYDHVVHAAGNFSASNCIGNGGFGATYKAEVAPGVFVAIKKLFVGKIQGVQQFHAEIKTLGRWHHPNLVTLIGFHVSEAEMFLIYNYLPGGNLERFISDRRKRPVDWRVLHKIALNVACALAYLHDTCVPRILHRDVKPSNILLDNDFNAYLSDFGLARLLGNSETHATTGVAGTFGYVAPEYAMTCRVSDKADVYSYGVVLLELLSDKKALDPSFSPYGNGFNIVNWANMLLKKGKARQFFTEGLWGVGPPDDLIEILHLGLKCTMDSLTNRPTMEQVVQQLKRIQP